MRMLKSFATFTLITYTKYIARNRDYENTQIRTLDTLRWFSLFAGIAGLLVQGRDDGPSRLDLDQARRDRVTSGAARARCRRCCSWTPSNGKDSLRS